MKRLATYALALSVSVALACGGTSKLDVGEPCSASTECAARLLCDFGMTPPTCQSQGTPMPDASLPDASLPDASLPDAPLPDAPLPDAPLPDAPLPDAPLPDAL